MATTSLWRVRGYIGKVLLYAENPEKTTIPKSIGFDDADKDTLEDVIAYASREEATNQRQLISGINCCPKTARTEMLHTKEAFDKESGTIAYHGYQSFQEGEVTPELAHTIGVRLATELWGDKYEVIVATHVDKASHIHNHFVINTVSFVDGRKFHRTKIDYLQMREKSDALCKEYGLSVIENPMGKGKHYAEWFAERNGEPTWRSIISDDVDVAVKSSMTNAPVHIKLDDTIAKNIGALYSEDKKVICVARGLESEKLFFSVARELARADGCDNTFLCDCAANIACIRYGIAPQDFDQISEEFHALETREKRDALSIIRDTAGKITERIDLNLQAERNKNEPER